MNRRTARSHSWTIIPPHMLESIAEKGSRAQRAMALRTLSLDSSIRSQRVEQLHVRLGAAAGVGPPHRNRRIHTAGNSTSLPGTLVRGEGQGASGDQAIDEAYDGLGATFDLFQDVYGRNSIDDNGMDLIGTVHFGDHYNNAFWNGSQMVFGDGDGTIFNRFTIAIDVMGHELAHGVTARTAGLEYHDQPGALNESMSDVFGSLVKQRSLGQNASQGDWLIGAGLLAAGINGVALRSMRAPGTAYNDPVLGKDPQPDHMSRFVNTTSDNGGVHINSGIPNKAFYLLAIALGGNAWDAAGHIWYRTLLDSRLSSTAQFQAFAELTVDNAKTLYGSAVQAATAQAWHEVGIDVALASAGRLEVFARGGDAAMWHNWQVTAGGGWSGWNTLGGWIEQPIVARNADGRLEAFVIGGDHGLWNNWQVSAGGGWSGWNSLGGWIDQLAVGQNADGRLEVFGRGSDRALWNNWQVSAGGGWSGWNSLGGWVDQPAVARNADGRLEVFVVGSDAGLYNNWQVSAGGGWSGWNALGGWVEQPVVAVNGDGRLEAFVIGGDHGLWNNWQVSAGGGWSGWNSLGGWIDQLTVGQNAS